MENNPEQIRPPVVEAGREVAQIKPVEQADTSRVLDAADQVAREILNNPEKKGEYEKKAADALSHFGDNMKECNQRIHDAQQQALNQCTDVTGDKLDGSNPKVKIGEKVGMIVEGLQNGSLSVQDAGILLALQTTEDNSNHALNAFADATRQGAQEVSRDQPK